MLDAHVCEVDIAVDHVRDNLANLASTHLIGDQAHGLEIKPIGFAQAQAFIPGNFLAV
jgi:hypothetical protein